MCTIKCFDKFNYYNYNSLGILLRDLRTTVRFKSAWNIAYTFVPFPLSNNINLEMYKLHTKVYTFICTYIGICFVSVSAMREDVRWERSE